MPATRRMTRTRRSSEHLSPCFGCGWMEFSIGLESAYSGNAWNCGHSREMAFGIHQEKGHFGIIICDTQN